MSTIPYPHFYVYVLARPNGKPFYVGKGHGRRVHDHEMEARSNHKCHKCNIIRKIWRQGGQVQRYMVFTTEHEDEALAYECEMIALFGRKNLCNHTDGGEGRSGSVASEAARKKMHEAQKRIASDPEERERRRKRMTEQWQDPDLRQKRIDAQAKAFSKPSVKERLSNGLRRRWTSEEARKQQSERMREMYQKDDIRANHMKAMRDPDFREKARETANTQWSNSDARALASARMKKKWDDPAFREYMIAARARKKQGDT